MKLSEWAQIAEIVGGAAIIASLVFVGIEVRENTSVVRAQFDRAIDQQNVSLNIVVAENADFAEVLVRAEVDRDSLDPAELARFDNYCLARFGAYENVVGNFSEGFVSSQEFDIWTRHFEDRFSRPGYRQCWLNYRDGYFPRFRAWADARFNVE